ncbi:MULTISPECIES: UDP-N-acetylglucosamine--undecaprenyl-phosphate N-acetylglucosaminephosphotransferase [unclassified Vibrio]|uniref:Undecaprenyl-phosphate alpha-N-acetylglucosaminyl 1-phosphate transferase n=1 Tax=Vibrio sp. HB236076 TaxID=3232307 RepID=A0AB39HDI0_9VIBR|nr:UDP-N-acetylglucosamine--undecaprenyl-phosphate N-acetylglucosaminephosphotransferase [Vibrio sp. HB161653]MDP5255389.1 UDP-N-acetylglucosamine--undecaprenyl-phosphate N-acetylglucosaminephosphotransferase [Vibrio sp. HB161653]
MITLIALTLTISIFSLLSLRKVAIVYDLVDKPTHRKVHEGNIPFIGGQALFVTLVSMGLWQPNLIPHSFEYLMVSGILVAVGTVDDKLNIRASTRLVILLLLSLWLIYVKGISLTQLGNLFGTGDIDVGAGSVVLTTAAIIGCICAFNMVDGIDGLLGGLASVTFAGLGFLFWYSGDVNLAYFCSLFVLAMLPYIFFNLDLIPKRSFKVFMGDSGSFLIGFTIVWLLIHSSQVLPDGSTTSLVLQPVTALWLIALPLMDMAMVMIRRMKKRRSPFKPDRLHLHHLCVRLGMSARQTLAFIVALSVLLACLGIWAQLQGVPESLMLATFIALFLLYVVIISYIWRISTFIRQWRQA